MMRHVYIRVILALIWLVAAIISGVSGNMKMIVFYALLCAVFWYSAYSSWKK